MRAGSEPTTSADAMRIGAGARTAGGPPVGDERADRGRGEGAGGRIGGDRRRRSDPEREVTRVVGGKVVGLELDAAGEPSAFRGTRARARPARRAPWRRARAVRPPSMIRYPTESRVSTRAVIGPRGVQRAGSAAAARTARFCGGRPTGTKQRERHRRRARQRPTQCAARRWRRRCRATAASPRAPRPRRGRARERDRPPLRTARRAPARRAARRGSHRARVRRR